ncbi:MAG: insulinase family protein [Thermodesulfovibrionales bacterium]|nr:insulinase family protein [Thermodesulfovibrionales bacterium]
MSFFSPIIYKSRDVFRFYFSVILTLFIFFFLSSYAYGLSIKNLSHPSGLNILFVERHNLPIVAINFLIKASPLNEDYEKAGVAYLTANMLREGTLNRTSAEIDESIEFIGASLEISVTRDYTTLSLSLLKKDLEQGFQVLADIIQRPSFPENEIKRKKELLKGMLKQKEEDPSYIVSKVFLKELFGNHSYGRATEGTIETLDRITRDDLVQFYIDYYLPNNSIMVVVGSIDETEISFLIDKYLKDWFKRTTTIVPKEKFIHQIYREIQSPEIKFIERDITQANIILGHRGISRDNPDYYDIVVMNYILGGGGFSSRLMKIIRDQMGLTYSIHSAFSANKYPAEFYIEVQTKHESADMVIREILRQMKKMVMENISEEEVEEAKAFLIGSFPRRFETIKKIADFLALVEFYQLGKDYIIKYPEYIKKVTQESVKSAAIKYLNPHNYIVVIAGKKDKINLSDIEKSEQLR